MQYKHMHKNSQEQSKVKSIIKIIIKLLRLKSIIINFRSRGRDSIAKSKGMRK